jgi:uncharacterized protein (TIGR02996 family)
MLHTHDFLSAIEAHPADRTARLVYADWLDEHNDARGELVRIEEEMRALPVFADRFWELKPRRNELRSLAGAEWCGRMRYGTECEPVFRYGIPEGWRERWRLIREFTERWHGVPMGDVGGRQAEVEEAEARLGRKLPPSVREWFVITEELRGPNGVHNVLGEVELRAFPQQAAITLTDYGGAPIALFTGISDNDLDKPDPPLRCYHEHPHGTLDLRGGFVIAERVTDYLFQEWLPWTFIGFDSFLTRADIPCHLVDELREAFPPPVVVTCEDYAQEFYEVDNILIRQVIRLQPKPPYPSRSVSAKAFKRLPREQVPQILWEFVKLCSSPHGTFAPDDNP